MNVPHASDMQAILAYRPFRKTIPGPKDDLDYDWL